MGINHRHLIHLLTRGVGVWGPRRFFSFSADLPISIVVPFGWMAAQFIFMSKGFGYLFDVAACSNTLTRWKRSNLSTEAGSHFILRADFGMNNVRGTQYECINCLPFSVTEYEWKVTFSSSVRLDRQMAFVREGTKGTVTTAKNKGEWSEIEVIT